MKGLNNFKLIFGLIEYAAFHLTMAEDIFYTSTHEITIKIDHPLDHKSSLSKLKRTQITEIIYSDYYAMELKTTTVTASITISTSITIIIIIIITNTIKKKASIQSHIFENWVIYFKLTHES